MFRAIAAVLRFALWLVRRVLFGPRRKRTIPPASGPTMTLPASFQSVAAQAFSIDAAVQDAQQGAPPLEQKPQRPRKVKLQYRVALGGVVLGTGVMMLIFAIMMVYYTVAFPDPLALRNAAHAPLVKILAADGATLAERGAPHEYISLDKMAKALPAAVVATEDRRFFDHYGVDPVGMLRAMFTNLRAGRFAQGGSTLTQQLAKNLFLTQDRTLSRKIAEFGLALWLEVRLTKPEILELYLNQVYFGGGAYGVEAASERYFDKSASALTIPEAALIAGLLKAPSKYSPAASPGAARARARVVITKMFDAGFISDAQQTQALAQTLVFNEQKVAKTSADAGYVIDYVLDQLPASVPEDQSGIVVETTIDKTLQRRAQEIVTQTLTQKGEAYGATQAALTVLDGNGAIRAMVGGEDYAESQFNRALKAKRQPGSAFKPFIYLSALAKGMSPDSVIDDAPITIGGWSPKNDNGQYAGPIPMRRAIAQSINTVAVRLNQDIGKGTAIDLAERLGIKSELHDGPSLALGTSEVTLLEMAGAYAAFSNGGHAVAPHVITRITTESGRVLFAYQPPPNAQPIAEADRIGALNDMLNGAVVYGTGKRAALSDRPAAGKTGTTQDFRDAWFIGYTAQLTAGVWVGNDNGKPMNRATGGSLPAEIWRQVMRVGHEGLPPQVLPGTVAANPESEASVWGGLASGSHLPRVVEAKEVLPWRRAASTEPARFPVESSFSPPFSRVSPRAAHPANGIGDDFIEKALATTAGDDKSPAHVAAQEAATAQSGKFPFSSWW